MRRITIFVLAMAVAVGFSTSTARAGCNDPRVDDVRASINRDCPCTGNHGQYVSCVARHVRDAVRDRLLDVNCKGAVTRCAARSTCGKKSDFRTCAICEPGTCTDGHCDDRVTECADSSTCPQILTRCSTKSSEDLCLARGGVPSTGSCCDASCPPPQ